MRKGMKGYLTQFDDSAKVVFRKYQGRKNDWLLCGLKSVREEWERIKSVYDDSPAIFWPIRRIGNFNPVLMLFANLMINEWWHKNKKMKVPRYVTLGAVDTTSAPYSCFNLSPNTSICKSPRNPTRNPNPRTSLWEFENREEEEEEEKIPIIRIYNDWRIC